MKSPGFSAGCAEFLPPVRRAASHGIRKSNVALTTGLYEPANGIFSDFSTPCGGLNEAILINYMSSHDDLTSVNQNQTMTDNVIAHELYHRLTLRLGNSTLDTAGFYGNDVLNEPFQTRGHRKRVDCDPDRHHLMCAEDRPRYYRLHVGGSGPTDKDDDLANVQNSIGTTLILPDYAAP